MPNQPHLQINDLTMAYGSFLIQKDLTFNINRGDIFIIMGGSGCGKSTLLRHLVGLKAPAKGTIAYHGVSFWDAPEDERAKLMQKIGILYQSGAVYRPVTFQIEFNRIHFRGERRGRGQEMHDGIELLVQQKGLRARLATQSILTGRLKIEMGYFPETPIERKNRDPDVWELPTIPSPLSMAKQDIQELPLGEIVQEAYRALKNMADLLDPEKTGQTITALNKTLADLDGILSHVRMKIDPLTTESVGVMNDLRGTFRDIQDLLADVDKNMRPLLENMTEISGRVNIMLDPNAPMRGEAAQLLGEMRETSRSIRLFMEHLEQQPESLLRGKR